MEIWQRPKVHTGFLLSTLVLQLLFRAHFALTNGNERCLYSFTRSVAGNIHGCQISLFLLRFCRRIHFILLPCHAERKIQRKVMYFRAGYAVVIREIRQRRRWCRRTIKEIYTRPRLLQRSVVAPETYAICISHHGGKEQKTPNDVALLCGVEWFSIRGADHATSRLIS